MADKIVSPGVFTKENDLSFLQQGVADIGAAFIGPFKEGPIVPTIVNSQTEFETLFGTVDDTYYTPLAVQSYLREAGTATICRVAGTAGYTEPDALAIFVTGSGIPAKIVSVLYNTNTDSDGFGDFGVIQTTGGALNISSSVLGYSGSTSLQSGSTDNIENTFGTSPFGSKGGYSYAFFKQHGVNLSTGSLQIRAIAQSQNYDTSATEANTPIIQSQLISGERYDLFRFITIGAGNSANTKIKVGISNIKAAGTVAGTDYGTFTVTVRAYGDTNKKRTVLETYSNVNLDPNSPNYINRVIGDRSRELASDGKITEHGDWVSNSKYIRIWNSNDADYVSPEKAPVQAVPFGHSAYKTPFSFGQYDTFIPSVTFIAASSTQFGGIDLDNNTDNKIYIRPLTNSSGVGSNVAFGLDAVNGGELSLDANNTPVSDRNFIVAFQGGFDGMSPATPIYKGNDINPGNTQGFDLSTSDASGTAAYLKHISALSNADEWDINMIVAPGVISSQHSYVANELIDLCEQRSDCFYIMDSTQQNDSVADATSTSYFNATAIDSNYAATYYPWVKTIDVNTNKLISVPPSVLLPGVFASNDRVAAEWFAPAGLNRGGLTGAVSVLNRLTQSEKDTLYEGKVNPIVQFPGQGIVVFGQKTLQDKPSALDRINVRRLLLTVRKYIASTSRYLVFEQNTAETRNRFLNIVNPYLEAIQQRQGLYAFKVVMDASNNTPDVIDRNIMKGAIYLQPTKTAEFIQIDFNILPTGAAFNG